MQYVKWVTTAVLSAALVLAGTAASGYVSTGLLTYLDVGEGASFTDVSSAWQDLSSNNVDGTFSDDGDGGTEAITYDSDTQALNFPGGTNGTAYVELDTTVEKFDDFSSGFTIEFEGEFGATRAQWERVFDFSEALDSTADGTDNAFWLGQFGNSNELTLEIFEGGDRKGYCHTATGSTKGTGSVQKGTALGPLTGEGARDFAKWTVTIEATSPYKCRIYKNGVALPTLVTLSATTVYDSADGTTSGSNYQLPPNVERPSAFVGRSNFLADSDLEGQLRYIRIYDTTLTQSEVEENAGITSTVSSSADETPAATSCQSGIFLTLTGSTSDSLADSPVIYGACALSPGAPYSLTVETLGSTSEAKRLVASGAVPRSGAFERTIHLPPLVAGNHKVIMSSTHPLGYPLRLTNLISVDSDQSYTSKSAEILQPHLK